MRQHTVVYIYCEYICEAHFRMLLRLLAIFIDILKRSAYDILYIAKYAHSCR